MADSPIFSAISTSARQLYLLLRCIAFAPRAEVCITTTGIRFTVDEAHSMQGQTFLEKSLFSSYKLNITGDESSIPPFQISITALLETLQIFGISDSNPSYRNQGGGFTSTYAAAFNTPALALGGTCRFAYSQAGAPLNIIIQEGPVTTTCELNTYTVLSDYEADEGIPLDRNGLCLKLVTRSWWLHDAIAELSNTNPTELHLTASATRTPYFALEGVGGPFGESLVDFRPETKSENSSSAASGRPSKRGTPLIAEVFSVGAPAGTQGRIRQAYKFDMIKKAGRAMALASKVSIRQDHQGVLSLQFMVEVSDGNSGAGSGGNGGGIGDAMGGSSTGRVSFVEFRFVPLVDEGDGDGESEYSDTNEDRTVQGDSGDQAEDDDDDNVEALMV